MATQTATLTFSLPEDQDSNQIIIWESDAERGTYAQAELHGYSYGVTSLQLDIDDTSWYKIQFRNTNNGTSGPISDAVYGGTFSHGAPFLAVSTSTDGANYATTAEVYDYSGLNTQDVSQTKVSQALKRARATIDYRTSEMDLDRFEIFDTATARRKFNASLRILKEAEINIALGHLYQSLADDIIIENRRGGDDAAAGGVSIGGASVGGDTLAERSENIVFLATLSDRYFLTGEQLLASLDTNSVRLSGYDYRIRFPRFVFPFNGYGGYRPRGGGGFYY